MANKKFYYKKRKPSTQNQQTKEAVERQTAKYSEQQLTLPLENLGLSETSFELLAKNRIKTAGDIVKRTEKDMYKIQGLNKKILAEVKNALHQHGMALRVDDGEKSDQRPQSKNLQNQEQKSGKNDKKTRFGLADRDDKYGEDKPQDKKEQKQRQEKLTEPLPIEEWRKVLKGGKWGYSNGFSIVIPTMYDEIFAFKEGLASVEIDEKCGYIDKDNNLVIPLMYDTAMSFSEGLAMVCVGEKCGYINKQNEMVIAPEFDAATPFENGEAKVKKDGKWATITPNGALTWI